MFPNRATSRKGRIQKIKALILSALALLALPTLAAEVNHCSDADTCWVKEGGKNFKIRLSGIDAPESDQPYGTEAKRFMNNLVGHKQVTLKCSGGSYDRKTCDIFLNGKDVSAVLVSAGYAWDYPEYSKGLYAQEQATAKAAKVGLWKGENITSPFCWRWTGKDSCNRDPQHQP